MERQLLKPQPGVRARLRFGAAPSGRLQAALRAHCVARGARPSAHFASRVRYAKRLVAANRWVPFLCTDLNSYSLWFARF